MKKLISKKNIVLSVIVLIFIFFYFGISYMKNQKTPGTIYYKIYLLVPQEVKQFLKKTVFIIPTLKRDNVSLVKTRNFLLYKAKSIESKYYLTLEHELKKTENRNINSVLLKKFLTKPISLNNNKLKFDYFQVSSLNNPKHANAISTSYLSDFEDKIIFATGDGNFYYFSKNDLLNEQFEAIEIKSNFKNFMKYPQFYEKSMYGIKDLFIKDNKLFVTSSSEKEKNCFNTAIYNADISLSSLNFNMFYQPSLCVKKELEEIDEFSPYHSGGRLFDFDKDHILFSVGEWRNRPAAQDVSNNLGKIIKINQANISTKIISMGHRNVQGLYYDDVNKTIISTEHGPVDGDEININKTVDDKIVNFGWPISSYGTHYGEKKWQAKGINQYEKAPLNKSHKKYGFTEPIKYYSPALGISQIIKISEKFKINGGNEYFLATMGSASGNGLGLRYIKFDEKYNKILEEKHFYLKERIRDIIYIDSLNEYLLFFETSGSVAVLSYEN